MMDIKIKNLNVGFKNKLGVVPAIKNLSLEIHSGSCTGILGESGSGKSVLAMALLNLLPPYIVKEGDIFIGSTNVLELQKKKDFYGKEFAFIPQSPSEALSPLMSIQKQFQHTIKDGGYMALASKILSKLGFSKPSTILSSYPYELSGGMLQRVLASLSTANIPNWLIADEPTKGLDEKTLSTCYSLFKNLHTEQKVNMIVITHDILFAKYLCNEIVIMYDGQVVEYGENVLEEPYHPYTKGFIMSLPENGFQPMEGMAPGPYDVVKGCSFFDRCPYKKERCGLEVPKLYEYKNRKVKCFLYDKND